MTEKNHLQNIYLALRTSPLFKGLEEEKISKIINALEPEHWQKHRMVMSPDDTMNRFYILVKGRVKIINQNPKTGRLITLFLLGPGDGFNIISLLGSQRHELTAETLDKVEALSAPAEQWMEWISTYPALHLAMHRYVVSRLHELSELASDLALYDTMTRLVHLILRYFSDSDDNIANRSNLIKDLPHAELAHMIGTVRVVVNRLLSELRTEGIINTAGGEIHIKNLEKLLQKAEHYIHP